MASDFSDLKTRLVVAATAALGLGAGCSASDEAEPAASEQAPASTQTSGTEQPAAAPAMAMEPTEAEPPEEAESEESAPQDSADDGVLDTTTRRPIEQGAGPAPSASAPVRSDDDEAPELNEDPGAPSAAPSRDRAAPRIQRRVAPRGAPSQEVVCGASCGADCGGVPDDDGDE